MLSVVMVNDISNSLPSPEQQQERIPLIEDIRARMSSAVIQKRMPANGFETFRHELERRQFNIIEMQDMAFLVGQDKMVAKCKTMVGDPENENRSDTIADFLKLLQDDKRIAILFDHYQKECAPCFKKNPF